VTVTLTYHGHACFSVEGGGKTIWLDPYLTDNPQADVSPDEIVTAVEIKEGQGRGGLDPPSRKEEEDLFYVYYTVPPTLVQ
jgi:L-ascorbate metabolism protein UlaG (beta-lactamase superfamily)